MKFDLKTMKHLSLILVLSLIVVFFLFGDFIFGTKYETFTGNEEAEETEETEEAEEVEETEEAVEENKKEKCSMVCKLCKLRKYKSKNCDVCLYCSEQNKDNKMIEDVLNGVFHSENTEVLKNTKLDETVYNIDYDVNKFADFTGSNIDYKGNVDDKLSSRFLKFMQNHLGFDETKSDENHDEEEQMPKYAFPYAYVSNTGVNDGTVLASMS